MADFSTTLTADLTTSDEVIHVADNTGARTTYPWRLVVDDEVMYVFDGVAEGLDWGVHRGADDTDPAEHLAGALATAEPASPPGVGLAVSLLGPFPIAFDTPGLDDGVALAELPAGTIVIRAWMIVTTPTSEPEHLLIIAIGGPGYSQSGDGDTHHLIVYGVAEDLTGNFNEDTYAVEPGIGIDANPQGVSKVGMATAEGAVLVALSSDLGTATSGSFDIYAMIATPA